MAKTSLVSSQYSLKSRLALREGARKKTARFFVRLNPRAPGPKCLRRPAALGAVVLLALSEVTLERGVGALRVGAAGREVAVELGLDGWPGGEGIGQRARNARRRERVKG